MSRRVDELSTDDGSARGRRRRPGRGERRRLAGAACRLKVRLAPCLPGRLPAAALALGLTVAALGSGAAPASAAESVTGAAIGSPAGTIWTVPVGVQAITATVIGADGGGGGTVNIPGVGITIASEGAAGAGGVENVTIPVTAGEQLQFFTSTAGDAANGGRTGGVGWADGGAGGSGNEEGGSGGGGGGASAIVAVSSGAPLVVAAGGGAGGGTGGAFVDCNGGDGGAAGQGGANANGACDGTGSGGAAAAASGTSGTDGGDPGSLTDAGGGGGGGGGYVGGDGASSGSAGGGGGGGGGGGSSYVDATAGVVQNGAGYNGNGNGSITINYTISEATQINVTSSANPSVYGNPATLTVAVTDSADSTQTPTGTVTLTDGTTTLATAALDNSGDATFTAPGTVGASNLVATYTPTAGTIFGASSTTFTQLVNRAPVTVTAVSSNPDAITVAPPTISVLVAPQQTGLTQIPGGTVTALQNGQVLSTAPLNAGGLATFRDLVSAAGLHELQFEYSPASNSDFAPGTGTLTQVIGEAAVTLTASSSDAAATAADPPTLSVLVSPQQPGLPTPTGTVTASENGIALSTVPVDAAGVATFPDLVTAIGTHNLTFTYTPASSSGYAAGLTPFVQTVSAYPVEATALTVVSNDRYPIYGGQRPAFTVQVTPAQPGATGTPSGTVSAYRDGTRVASAVIGPNGTASFSNLLIRPGKYDMQFIYIPAANALFAAGNASYVQIMRPAPVVMGTTSRSHVVVYGDTVPITVTVRPRELGLSPDPTGTITVSEAISSRSRDGRKAASGERVLAVKRLFGNGSVSFGGLAVAIGVDHLKFTYTPAAWDPYLAGVTQRYQVTRRATVKLALGTSDRRGNRTLRSPQLTVRVAAPHPGTMKAPAGKLIISRDGRIVKTAKVRAGALQWFGVIPVPRGWNALTAAAPRYRFVVRFVPKDGSPYRFARAVLLLP